MRREKRKVSGGRAGSSMHDLTFIGPSLPLNERNVLPNSPLKMICPTCNKKAVDYKYILTSLT